MVEFIAFDLQGMKETAVLDLPTHHNMLQLQQKELEESQRLGLSNIGERNPLTCLRRVRESMASVRSDLAFFQSTDLKHLSSESRVCQYEAILWCYEMLRHGLMLEMAIERRVLDERIVHVRLAQACLEPCTHEYIRMLLDLENLEITRLRSKQYCENKMDEVVSEEHETVLALLLTLDPNDPRDEALTERLMQLNIWSRSGEILP